MALFHRRLTEARRAVQDALPRDERAALKGSRWLWTTNRENLSAAQRVELTALCRRFPKLGMLRALRDGLRQVFEDRRVTTAAAGRRRLERWCERAEKLGAGVAGVAEFVKTLEAWWGEVANYFVARSSNGRTEGFNHGLRQILWRACGMTNFEHFRLRVLHVFG